MVATFVRWGYRKSVIVRQGACDEVPQCEQTNLFFLKTHTFCHLFILPCDTSVILFQSSDYTVAETNNK